MGGAVLAFQTPVDPRDGEKIMPTESSVDPQKIPQQPKGGLTYEMPGERYFNEDAMNVDSNMRQPVMVEEFHIPPQIYNPSETVPA